MVQNAVMGYLNGLGRSRTARRQLQEGHRIIAGRTFITLGRCQQQVCINDRFAITEPFPGGLYAIPLCRDDKISVIVCHVIQLLGDAIALTVVIGHCHVEWTQPCQQCPPPYCKETLIVPHLQQQNGSR